MRKLLVLVPFVVVLIFSGCEFFGSDTSGMLVLSVSNNLTVQTIEPDFDMTPVTYEVLGTGPGGATFAQTVTITSVMQASLIPGEWTIDVTALNGDGVPVGEGSATVTIQAGQVAIASVTIRPIPGDGTLDVTVTWPARVLTTPVLSATLTPTGGTPATIPFTAGTDSSRHLAGHGDGYYTLAIRLEDEGDVVWGTVEAVRIITGKESIKLYALVEDVNRGGLELAIVPELENPIDVTLSGQTSIMIGDTMTVGATTSESVDTYQWYLQGAPIAGATSDSVTVGAGLGLAHYWLSLVVTKGSIVSSASMEFDVVELSVPQIGDGDDGPPSPVTPETDAVAPPPPPASNQPA